MHNNSYLELDAQAFKTNIEFLRKHFSIFLMLRMNFGRSFLRTFKKFMEFQFYLFIIICFDIMNKFNFKRKICSG